MSPNCIFTLPEFCHIPKFHDIKELCYVSKITQLPDSIILPKFCYVGRIPLNYWYSVTLQEIHHVTIPDLSYITRIQEYYWILLQEFHCIMFMDFCKLSDISYVI